MKLLVKQEHAVYFLKDNVTEEVLYGGAAGGGKSALGCLWLMEMCQKYPGTRWLMGRSKLRNLKDTTLKTFFELSAKLNLGKQFQYKAQENTIRWANGSEIVLKDLFHYPSDPNFESLGSLEITGAFIDECSLQAVTEEMEQVKLRDIDKDGRQGIVSKDRVKENIGRSPDEWDSIMMRYWFALRKTYTTRVRVGK